MASEKAKAAFWARVRKVEGDGCWLWTKSLDTYGYGQFGYRRAHRMAYKFIYGSIPDGLFVLHRCDNPPCCRPDHLFLGTNADNMADKVAKGRQSHNGGGPLGGRSKGSIREMSPGYWEVRVYVGNRKQKGRCVRGTRADAERVRDELRAEFYPIEKSHR